MHTANVKSLWHFFLLCSSPFHCFCIRAWLFFLSQINLTFDCTTLCFQGMFFFVSLIKVLSQVLWATTFQSLCSCGFALERLHLSFFVNKKVNHCQVCSQVYGFCCSWCNNKTMIWVVSLWFHWFYWYSVGQFEFTRGWTFSGHLTIYDLFCHDVTSNDGQAFKEANQFLEVAKVSFLTNIFSGLCPFLL